MLRSLYIENLAVIARAEVTFEKGLNVFTGETGAGKTVLLSALGAVMGQRVSKDMIRTGETNARIHAVFALLSPAVCQTLEEMGYSPDEEGQLLITRVVKPDSSECRINGQPATATILKSLAPMLVDLHGQQDNSRLLSPEYHLSLIDHFGKLEKTVQEYNTVYAEMCNFLHKLQRLQLNEEEKARRIDLLQYQIDEITDAALIPGEEEKLEADRLLMRNAEKITTSLEKAKAILNPDYGEQEGVLEQLSSLAEALSISAQYIQDLETPANRLAEISYELSDLNRDLSGYMETVEYSPQQLDEIEERLSLIHNLKLKYAPTIEEILSYCNHAQEELDSLHMADHDRALWLEKYNHAKDTAKMLADKLTQARRKAGDAFCLAVQRELTYLDMPAVRMSICHETKGLSPSGQDTLALMISANPGETPKPLSKIASGGEISRIMLSVKNVLSAEEDFVTSIFDEVDAGVSGRAADKIGLKLSMVARGRQVLCVTHLAQVAAYADNHLYIKKQTHEGHTFTKVYTLNINERANELARIVSGDAITETALAASREMLARAASQKTIKS